MKDNFSKYFPVSDKELDKFKDIVKKYSGIGPPKGGFERLIEAQKANKKLIEFRKSKSKPSSFGSLIDILSTALGKNKFSLSMEFELEDEKWRKVILNEASPDILPAKVYAAIAKINLLPFNTIKEAISGSFKLIILNIPQSFSSAFPRSSYVNEKSETYSQDLKAATEELLLKSRKYKKLKEEDITRINKFLKEIFLWMK